MTAVVEPTYRSPNSDLATHKFRGQMELEEYGDSVPIHRLERSVVQ
jgi:hypothetical protein